MKIKLLINKKKNHEWFDFHVSINNFLSVKHRMRSYLTCGLSAEKSYIKRKADIISFLSSI